ncbi:hypothetical protein PHISCL_07341 [Aspergillus sclerotialis]|uniref:Uncharacterized protein n=1 Tax=Aspergillus sclerotialis TaxID=2070753 RepID=A0A3A2ZB32_9EURO|nr:hypothetical protein PHISCL_07341 [Aspergillus sclerotialis]
MTKRVLLVGIDPATIDFTHPDYARFASLDAARVRESLENDVSRLEQLGYKPSLCLAAVEALPSIVQHRLEVDTYDCILIGAGVRVIPHNFTVFEQLVNVVHQRAPHAKICFNTGPHDSTEAVQRWI